MSTTSTITKSLAGVVTLAMATIGVGVAAPEASAYQTVSGQPTIGCMLGLLELHGRTVTGSYRGERVYSAFYLYKWTTDGWQLDQRTGWAALDVGPTQIASNEATGYEERGAYYYAWEVIASWDGTQWQYDWAYTKLMDSYAAYGDYYGKGYYARCS